MKDIKIFFSEDTEEMEMICTMEKGYRWDVIVQIGGDFYNPQFHTLQSVSNGFNYCIKNNLIYDIDPCLIMVQEVKKSFIVDAIIHLHEKLNFFTNFIPESNIDILKMVQVYPQ